MTNNASKGSKIEKEALEDIVKVFDEHAARDRSKADYDTGEKADRDLATTVPVCIQVKGGKQPSIHKCVDQAYEAANDTEYTMALVKYDRDARSHPGDGRKSRWYMVMLAEEGAEILSKLSEEGVW